MPGLAMDVSTQRFTGLKLIPQYAGSHNRKLDVNFGPNLIIKLGQTVAINTVTVADVQTFSITGAPTGGSFTLGVNVGGAVQNTGQIVWNAASAGAETGLGTVASPYVSVKGALLALLGAGTVTATGGALPAVAPVVVTFAGSYAGTPVPVMTATLTNLTGGTPVFSIAHTTTGATANTATAYVLGGGTNTAWGFSEYDVATDASGNVTLGQQSGGGPHGEQYLAAPIYVSGIFNLSDLVNFDAQALTGLSGKLLAGTVASGVGVVTIP